jgi:hypothetical protein
LGMIALPCIGYPSSFDVFDVLEHELDGIDGWLTRYEDHWNVSPEIRAPPVGRCKISKLCAPHGVLVWQFAT